MSVAVGVMAYNEGLTIAGAVRSVSEQRGDHLDELEIVVVASGCTDDTVARARAATSDPRVRILEQPVREGKAAAVGALLRELPGRDVVVLAGGDTRLEAGALEALLAPFDDPTVGMTGGRPIPVNEPSTLMGRVVRLLWELHHAVALRAPKLGELVAFRPGVGELPAKTSVDEASIGSLVVAKGMRLVYVPEARVRMRGPATVRDFLAQRRRIHAGHLALRRRTGHRVSTMRAGHVLGAVRAAGFGTAGGAMTLAAAASLEACARLLGAWDCRVAGRDHHVWARIASTKEPVP